MTSKILIVGGDGLIGGALAPHLEAAAHDVVVTSRGRRVNGRIKLDLGAEPGSWDQIPEVDAAVICAGMTSLVGCMKDPAASRRVNVEGTLALTRALVARGVFTVFLSSNQVFDGTAPRIERTAKRSPVSEYGRQKAAAEDAIAALPRTAILRLAKVLTPESALLAGWRKALKAGKPITPFANFGLSPIPVEFTLDLITRILKARETGVFHASGYDDIPYYDVASMLANRLGADSSLVKPTLAQAAAIGFDVLPKYSSLDMAREAALFGVTQPPSRHVISAIAAAAAQPKRNGAKAKRAA